MNRDLTVIILTFNEELHIRKAIESAMKVADKVFVVDSFSSDSTISIAQDMGAKVFQNPFTNQASQLEWAIDNTDIKTTWIMRMDADEFLTDELVNEINTKIPLFSDSISGIYLKRRVYFMGKWIRHGGYYPIKLLRIWRRGHAVSEQRWMDEHIWLTKGKSVQFEYDFIDENLNSLTWWINKHNDYATREAIDILNRKHRFLDNRSYNDTPMHSGQVKMKRWYKNNLYLRAPMFLRCFLYFNYRYWIRLGVLDGQKGLIWHFLQGFWYRFLVDAKILQILCWSKNERKSIPKIIVEKFHINLK